MVPIMSPDIEEVNTEVQSKEAKMYVTGDVFGHKDS
jgi:hypothetical protein